MATGSSCVCVCVCVYKSPLLLLLDLYVCISSNVCARTTKDDFLLLACWFFVGLQAVCSRQWPGEGSYFPTQQVHVQNKGTLCRVVSTYAYLLTSVLVQQKVVCCCGLLVLVGLQAVCLCQWPRGGLLFPHTTDSCPKSGHIV